MNKIVFLILLFNFSVWGFAQCVPEPIETNKIEGYLVFGYGNAYRFLDSSDKIKVELLDIRHPKRVIASASIDGNARFAIKNVKPGRYRFSAQAENLIPISVEINVSPLPDTGSTSANRIIFVVLGADFTHECG